MDMALTMDSSKPTSSRDRAQHLFNKNLDLEKKRRDAAKGRTHLDPNVWQTMRENYEAIVLEDHEFAEKHDVEYALWQLHYRRIEELRSLFNAAVVSSGSGAPSNGKSSVQSGPDRLAKIRSQFKSFLSEATGFYHDMMVKIRAKYGLPLGYFSDVPDQIPTSKNGNKSDEVKKGLISCHRCLIYLGDLARYKGLYGEGASKARDLSAASSYYMQASSIWPSSGNPHHQLALLAGYSNDELLTVYRYFRSLAAENPFATARDNLIIAFEKNRQTYNQLINAMKNATEKVPPGKLESKVRRRVDPRTSIKGNKMEAVAAVVTSKDFTTRFIRLNGILFTRTSLETFPELLLAVKGDFVSLLSFGADEEFNFGSDAAECGLVIVRMAAILIFTVHNVSKENENQSYADILQRSVLLRNAITATFEFMGCIVDRCNQLKDPSKSFLLPGIGVFFEWLACHENLVAADDLNEEANARSFYWSSSVSLLNKLLLTGYILDKNNEDESCFTDMGKYDESETSNRLALPEDFELRGFVPLLPAQRILDFSRNHFLVSDSGHKENISRVQRIVAAGKALANTLQSSKDGLYFDSKLNKFVFGVEPKIFDDGSVINNLEHNFSSGFPAISFGGQMDISAAPNSDTYAEEDEEVIVFKPFTAEKTIDEISSKLASSANLSVVGENGKINIRTDDKSSVSKDTSMLQSTISFATTPSSLFTSGMGNGTSQYLQPVQPSMPVSNLVSDVSTMKVENWPLQMPELQGGYQVSQTAAVSLPIPQFSIAETSHGPSAQTLQTHLPFESVLPVGAPGLKKNPISRPLRRVGPPPGFGGPKVVIDPLRGVASRSENSKTPALDDYRWLDGYQLPPSHSAGFSSSMNQMGLKLPSVDQMEPACALGNQYGSAIPAVTQVGPMSSSLSKINGSMTAEMNSGHGNQVLHDYPFPEYMKHYENLAQQFHKDNQKVMDSVQPHQGDSAWGGRFFV